MALQFSTTGPAFPDVLVDAFLEGDVVFLCGAGISAPQLPNFKQLLDRVYKALGLEPEPSETASISSNRYEEVLGTLSRRLADPDEVRRVVGEILKSPTTPNFENHRIILRLSRDITNRPTIVTTNFDTLIEHALALVPNSGVIKDQSFAGQALPLPGSISFSGIIHMHGRLEDTALGLVQTPLILTSADYGDAYMRSGWAARFLFDLARCKTIVLVGYSAEDAPVRYFLNVLESDRERFSDLKPVYALDGVEGQENDSGAKWHALAVHPITYSIVSDGAANGKDHSALWNDLATLANLVEKPRAERRRRAKLLLERQLSSLGEVETQEITWIFRNRRDLWDIVINTVNDAKWFTFFQNKALWSESDASTVLIMWLSKDFQDKARLLEAMGWLDKLGHFFRQQLDQRILHTKELPPLWRRAWKVLLGSNLKRKTGSSERIFSIRQILREPGVLDADLQRAVKAITPDLLVDERAGLYKTSLSETPQKLSDFYFARLSVPDRQGANELLIELVQMSDVRARLMELATGKLSDCLSLAVDIGHIGGGSDMEDALLPSVEPHIQNNHRDGVVFLACLLSSLLEPLASENQNLAKQYAGRWRQMPGRIGIRLWLCALRRPELFSVQEIVESLLTINLVDFWSIKRELPILLHSRLRSAESATIMPLEARILEEGNTYYARFELTEGQPDWRPHARDQAVWLLLVKLNEGGALSDAGQRELADIQARRPELNRAVVERDFFGLYSSGARWVAGDPQPIISAAPDDRLRVAKELAASGDHDRQYGWAAFCSADPVAALETLASAPLRKENSDLWNDLLPALAVTRQQDGPIIEALKIRVCDHLRNADDDFLSEIADRFVGLLRTMPPDTVPNLPEFWQRLWNLIARQPDKELNFERDLYEEAINSPAGQLTEILLEEIETYTRASGAVPSPMIARLGEVASQSGTNGVIASAALIRNAAFLISFDLTIAERYLRPRLAKDGTEAASLRRILAEWGSITPEFSRLFSRAINRAVCESTATEFTAEAVAAKLIIPAFEILANQSAAEKWGVTIEAIARTLRNTSATIRSGVLLFLSRWMAQPDREDENLWSNAVGPFFAKLWPKERRFRDESHIELLLAIIAAAHDVPDALKLLKPYLLPYRGNHLFIEHVFPLDVVEQFPAEVLEIVWRIGGYGSGGNIYGLTSILDKIAEVDPSFEIDRRLQWLQQRAARYE